MADDGVTYNSYINEVLDAIDESVQRGLIAMGIFMKSKAILLAPVGDVAGGSLRQKIGYEVDDNVVRLFCNSKYAVYVEKGTGIYAEDGNGRRTPWVYYDQKRGEYFLTQGQKPQPFLTPAVFQNIEEIKKVFMKEMEDLEN